MQKQNFLQFSVHFYFSDNPKIQNNLGIGPLKNILVDINNGTTQTTLCPLTFLVWWRFRSVADHRPDLDMFRSWRTGPLWLSLETRAIPSWSRWAGALCLRMATSTFSNWSAVRRNSVNIFPGISNICFCNSLPANTAWVSTSNA